MTRVGKRIVEGLREFTEDLESGVDIERKYTVTRIELDIRETAYNGKRAKAVRKLLKVSQPIFAQFLGVSPQTIKSWEQDASPPGGMAARVLNWIEADPEYYRQRLQQVTTEKAATKSRRQGNDEGRVTNV